MKELLSALIAMAFGVMALYFMDRMGYVGLTLVVALLVYVITYIVAIILLNYKEWRDL